jgi:putative tributyrin esterase
MRSASPNVGMSVERLSPGRAAGHPTGMPNGSERLVRFATGLRVVRAVGRVAVAFTCLSLTYLVSGIPAGGLTDQDDPPSAGAHSGRSTDGAVADGSSSARLTSRVSAESFWSQALGIRKQFVVYLPPSYEASSQRRYPVAYYLHGMLGDEWNWVRSGAIDRTLDSLVASGLPEMIVVMPDGDDGWYTTWNNLGNNAECRRSRPPGRQSETVDAYCVPWPKYDDYIARDLVARVDSVYRTIPSRSARAIAGLSMGGYGAISLALAYPDVFSAAASHSGVLSPLYMGPHPYSAPSRYASTEAELRQNAGNLWPAMVLAFGRDTTGWWPRDPGRRAARYSSADRTRMPALMLDVGVADPYVDQSRDLHATLDRLGVTHAYAEWPGAHNWDYWRLHARESLRWIGGHIAGGAARQ